MNCYKVTAKCGHVGGLGYYIPIAFYTTAEDGREAARIIRYTPRVQHDKKDAILSVERIDREAYLRGCEEFEADPYIRCSNPQEQRLYSEQIDMRIRAERVEELPKKNCSNLRRSLRYGYDKPDYDGRKCA